MSTDNTPLQPSKCIQTTNVPRTLVLCFDGTGDQFNLTVRTPAPRQAALFGGSSSPLPNTDPLGTVTVHTQNSNVVKFFSLLKRDDPREQVVYYQVRGAALKDARSR